MTTSSANITLRYIFFYILLAAVGMLTLFIFLPYVITLAMATTFAVVCQPLYQALRRITKNRDAIAAILTIAATGVLVLAPLTLLGMQVVQEAASLYDTMNEEESLSSGNFLGTVETMIESQVRIYMPSFDLDLENVGRQSLTWFSTRIGPFFANTLQLILHFFLGIVAFYYLLKDGNLFIERMVDLSPLQDKHDRTIFKRLVVAINSIIKGSLLIAVLQGITSGIGFAIFGVPSAALWGCLAAIGALVPGVGSAIIITPVVGYLFFVEKTGAAVGLIIWGTFAVGMIDNFLGPLLVGRGVRIHPMFILFAVIGGIELFGPLGFILGPLVLSLLYALLDIYKLMTTKQLKAA